MFERLAYFIEFVRVFAHHAFHIREALVCLLLLIVLGGCTIAKVEDVKIADAVYFAFITGLSIGYGDIAPKTGMGQVVSVAIGLIGMLFVGLTVAVATRALADTVERSRNTN